MIGALQQFDQVTAAGILARAALAIEENPAGSLRLPNEQQVREALFAEALAANGIRPDDRQPETMARLGEILDAELDTLIEPRDSKAVLERLSARGDLPSDLFKVNVVPNIANFHRAKFKRELKLVERTVWSPDREQHFGPHPSGPEHPFLISLFAKQFVDVHPAHTFTMLVAGQRLGTSLIVHHAWRVYPADIDLRGAGTLVDVLRRFSEQYGVELVLGGKLGQFVLANEFPGKVDELKSAIRSDAGEKDKKGKSEIMISIFWQSSPVTGLMQGALGTAIDLVKYRRLLKAHGY